MIHLHQNDIFTKIQSKALRVLLFSICKSIAVVSSDGLGVVRRFAGPLWLFPVWFDSVEKIRVVNYDYEIGIGAWSHL